MASLGEKHCSNAPEGKEWLGDYVLAFLQSPSWTTPIEGFIKDHFSSFDLSNPEENKLEYTSLHGHFKNLIESLLAAHLLDIDVSPDEFAEVFEALCLADARLEPVAAQLASVDDFMVFKRMMIARYQVETTSGNASSSNNATELSTGKPELEQEQEALRQDAMRVLLSQMVSSNGQLEPQTLCEAVAPSTAAPVAAPVALQPMPMAAPVALPPMPMVVPSTKRSNRIAAIVANATQTTAGKEEKAAIYGMAGIGIATPASRFGA